MKTNNFCGILALCIAGLLFFSCTGPISIAENITSPSIKDTLSEHDFNTWVANWKADSLKAARTIYPEFFTLPKVDLQEILNEPGVAASRFYLGLDKSHAQDSIHLIVVGVNRYGNDMIDYNNGQYAYDVSRLCPILCVGGHNYVQNLENN